MELVVVFGPPAVGKMTVGREICQLTGFKLFHNHMTIEPVLAIFPYGSPAFDRLVAEFRARIFEEATDSALRGLVFTYVWALDLDEDTAVIASYVDLVCSRGGSVRFVELFAEQSERLERNGGELRLDHKRSKRDLELSRNHLLKSDEEYVLNTGASGRTRADDLLDEHDYVRFDNTRLEPSEVALRVVEHFGFAAV
ncbi:MAG: AAA family ATPase [Pseudonocardiales bacterium]